MPAMVDRKLAQPPLDGSLSAIWGVLDWQAEHNPSSPWLIFPSLDHPDEMTALTFSECCTASHKASYGLRLVRAEEGGIVVAVLLNTDTIHYVFILAGMMRAGLIPLPISRSTPPEIICDMLAKANCHRLLTQSTATLYPLISSIRSFCQEKHYQLRVDEAPAFGFILPQLKNKDARSTINVGPYPKSDRKYQPNDIVFYLQPSTSSGSTHPIPLTHEVVTQWQRTIARQGKDFYMPWAAMSLSTCDIYGVLMQLFMPLATGTPVVVFSPRTPAPPMVPNAQSTLEVARLAGCTGIVAEPAFVEEWAQDPEAIGHIAKMNVVTYAGARLSKSSEAKLAAAGISVNMLFGGFGGDAETATRDEDDSHSEDGQMYKLGPVRDWYNLHDAATVTIPNELRSLVCALKRYAGRAKVDGI